MEVKEEKEQKKKSHKRRSLKRGKFSISGIRKRQKRQVRTNSGFPERLLVFPQTLPVQFALAARRVLVFGISAS